MPFLPNEGLYHLSISDIQRSEGQDAVAAAAYRVGVDLISGRTGRPARFSHRSETVFAAGILVPRDAPVWATDRQALWDAVERSEARKDSRLAKEIEFALPYDIPRTQWTQLALEMAADFVARGHGVDYAIHLGEDGNNPHIHLMVTRRPLLPTGAFGKVARDFDQRAFYHGVRQKWEAVANAALGAVGSALRISSKSYAARGIAKVPGRHQGPNAKERAEKRAARRDGQLPAVPGPERTPSTAPMAADRVVSAREPREVSVSDRSLSEMIAAARSKMREERGELPSRAGATPERSDEQIERFDPDREEWVGAEREAAERAAEDKRIYQKALAMHRTKEEHRALKEAELLGPEHRKEVEALLIERRIDKVKQDEREARTRVLLKQARRFMKDQEQFERFADDIGAHEVLAPEMDRQGRPSSPVKDLWEEGRDMRDQDQIDRDAGRFR